MTAQHIVNLGIAILAGYLLANFVDIMRNSEEFYECQLNRQADVQYVTSRHQLEGKGKMIIMHKDGRTFMFKREDILACRGVER
jgi:hypothetical protein